MGSARTVRPVAERTPRHGASAICRSAAAAAARVVGRYRPLEAAAPSAGLVGASVVGLRVLSHSGRLAQW